MFWVTCLLGCLSVVAGVVALTRRPGACSLAWLSGSLLLGLFCLASVLWGNVGSDAATVLDTVEGWAYGACFLVVADALCAAVVVVRLARASRVE